MAMMSTLGAVSDIKIAPDSYLIASAELDGYVRIYDLEDTGKAIANVRCWLKVRNGLKTRYNAPHHGHVVARDLRDPWYRTARPIAERNEVWHGECSQSGAPELRSHQLGQGAFALRARGVCSRLRAREERAADGSLFSGREGWWRRTRAPLTRSVHLCAFLQFACTRDDNSFAAYNADASAKSDTVRVPPADF